MPKTCKRCSERNAFRFYPYCKECLGKVRAEKAKAKGGEPTEEKPDPTAAYQSWNEEEDARLVESFRKGLARKEIAALLGRSTGAVASRLKKLGLIVVEPADKKGDEFPPDAKLPEKIPPLFPFAEIRPGQKEFYDDLKAAASEGKHLVAYAPTGIGKTAASLAACLEYALANRKKILFLTTRQTQHQIALDTIRHMRKAHGIPIRAVDLIRKQDMCTKDARTLKPFQFANMCKRLRQEGKCIPREGHGEAGGFEQEFQAIEEAVLSGVLSAEEVREMCGSSAMRLCPYLGALSTTPACDVVICDYNYLISSPIRNVLLRKVKLQLGDFIAIVDEAHNLPERIRMMTDAVLTGRLVEKAAEEAEGFPAAYKDLKAGLKCVSAIFASIDGEERGLDREALRRAFEKLAPRFFGRQFAYSQFLELLSGGSGVSEKEGMQKTLEGKDVEGDDTKTALLRAWEFFERWESGEESAVRLMREGEFHYKQLDVSVVSKPIFEQLHASVMMSGTLYPMKMYSEVLGLEEKRALLREYASPFPKENRKVLIAGGVSTDYKSRCEQVYSKYADEIGKMAAATKGNTVVFFTSYDFLKNVGDRLKTAKPVLKEAREMGMAERLRLKGKLAKLKEGGGAILLAVMGGGLSEGIDFEGNMLSVVAIAGIPFERPTLEGRELIEYFNRRFCGKGWDYAVNAPAFNKVLQAAGRAIRKASDRAVIVLMDERFAEKKYARFLPEDYQGLARSGIADEIGVFDRRTA